MRVGASSPGAGAVVAAVRGEGVAASPSRSPDGSPSRSAAASPPPTNEQLLAVVAQLAHVAAHQAASSSSLSSSSGARTQVRMDKVDAFDGRSGEALDKWISQVTLKHRIYVVNGKYPEDQFIPHVASTLTDGALAWWDALAPAAQPTTWAAMRDELRKQFQPIDSKDVAMDKLRVLAQGPKQSVQEYAAAYRTLLTRAGLPGDHEKARAFMAGLRETRVKDELRRTKLASLDEAIELAVRMDDTGAAGSSAAAVSLAGAEAVSPRTVALQQATLTIAALQQELRELRSSPPQGSRYSTRRDRGANKTPRGALWTTVKGMTEELARARMEKRQCLHCGSDQHIMRDCKMREAGHPPRLN
jgi:hypothetical protein